MVMPVPSSRASAAASTSELIARQIVADERDPTLDQTSTWERVDDGALSVQNLGHGAGERTLFDVPSPCADRAADADRAHRLGDAFGMCDRAGLDDGGDAVLGALDGAQGCRQLVVVGCVRAVERNCPLEDRGSWCKQIGNATSHQWIAGEVLVGIDHSRSHDAIRGIDHSRVRVRGAQFCRRSHRCDQPVGHHDRPADQHVARRVHRHHIAARDDVLRHFKPRMKGRARAAGWRTLLANRAIAKIVTTLGAMARNDESIDL